MRLIDANKLPYYAVMGGNLVVYKDDIENAPTIEAEPVRHGRWIKKQEKDTFAGYLYSYKCSECGRIEKCKEPYCNCGAKMDGDTLDPT